MNIFTGTKRIGHSPASSRPTRRRVLAAAFGLSTLLVATASFGQEGTTFLQEVNAAMARMMAAMETDPTGDVDADFVAMMEPHHQGAIDMAVAELRYGKNEQLKRIAQEIIIDQQQEIAAMRMAVGRPLPAASPAPTAKGTTPAPRHHHEELAK